MRLKLDENLSRHLKTALAACGHDVTTAEEEGLLSQCDPAVARAATAGERMLLTLDVEFGDLRKYRPGSHAGIILFRPKSLGPLTVNRFVEGFIRDADLPRLAGCVVIVEPSRVRVRCPSTSSDLGEAREVPL
jgi:predicted nuclease of predicted toxin-antitoxin system